MCGPYPPYVGQTGCITGFRSLFARYREHLRAARALTNHFLGLRHRRVKSMMSFGKLPSLARMMARHGPAPVTIVGLQTVPDHQHGGQRERWWARVLAPTLNRVLPFGGIDRIRWTSILHGRQLGAQSGSMTALLQNLANTHCRGYSGDELLSLVSACVGHVGPRLFDSFFAHVRKVCMRDMGFRVQRRYGVRIPTYSAHIVRSVQSKICKTLGLMRLPPAVRAWYQCVLTVIPTTSPQASLASRPARGPEAPLLTKNVILRSISPDTLGEWRVPVTDSQVFYVVPHGTDLSQVKTNVLQNLHCMQCECHALMQHPLLSNALGHLVIRHPWQWEALVPPLMLMC